MGLMHRFSVGLWLGVLLCAGTAQAQFANRSLGLSVGYLSLENSDAGVDSGVPIGIDASLYIENGFDLTANFQVMILNQLDSQVVGVAPATGIRYLFSEESFRPYAGAD